MRPIVERARRRSGGDEDGVILVLFAVAMVVLVGITAVAVDGSFGFVQNRRAQNATDLAAFAASQQLQGSTYCSGTSVPTTADIEAVVQQLVTDNDPGVGTNWTAQFLYQNGQGVPDSTFSPTSDGGSPPPGACGVSVSAAPVWSPFFAGIFGVHRLKGFASGSVAEKPTGAPIGIVALNKVGPHEVLGGGTGSFVVSGNIFLNTDVDQQPWTSGSGGYQWDDAVDAKADSNLYVYGTVFSQNATFKNQPLWPLDHCFQAAGVQAGGAGGPTYDGASPSSAPPAERPACSEGSVTVAYDAIVNDVTQIDDPLQGSGAPPNPLSAGTDIACPNMTTQVYGAGTVTGSTTSLLPGEYTTPVHVTSAVTFEDCSGYAVDHGKDYPGVYRFDDGLFIDAPTGGSVTGTNVVIATESPYPVAGNTTGTAGNGGPCLPSGTFANSLNGGQSETSSTPCAGTSPTTYGVTAYTDSNEQPDSLVGTGANYSLEIGGAGAVDLTGPTTGPYAGNDGSPGLVLYQDPGTQANYGFDALAGDSAAIDITGVVYDASLADYGASSPRDYWDGSGGGVPFYAGGTLQTGFGTGWTGSGAPAQSSGSVTITGTTIVDDFNTDGTTGITIYGEPYQLPGAGKLSLIG